MAKPCYVCSPSLPVMPIHGCLVLDELSVTVVTAQQIMFALAHYISFQYG